MPYYILVSLYVFRKKMEKIKGLFRDFYLTVNLSQSNISTKRRFNIKHVHRQLAMRTIQILALNHQKRLITQRPYFLFNI